MHPGLVLLFLAMLATVIGVAYVVVFACFTGRIVRRVYLLLAIAMVILAYRMTFHYSYSPDPNTRIYGFPIPVVAFQRVDASSEWADFVGPTLVLGFPMNAVAYLVPMSLLFLLIAGIRLKWLDRQADLALIHRTTDCDSSTIN